MWILGSLKKEALFFWIPGALSIVFAVLYPDLGEHSLLYALLATAIIDSGHVYTTNWRTLFYPEERSSDLRYYIFPLFFFLLFACWFYLGAAGLWSFVVYSTLYHHVRQVYGFNKWYQAVNKRQDKRSDFYVYALSIMPIVTYHFRPNVVNAYYSDNDLFLYPDLLIVKVLIILYTLTAISWIITEMRLWKSGIKEPNRIIGIAFPALIYGYCFFVGRTVTQVLFPLLFIHGVAYCGVMAQTLQRTQARRFASFGKGLLIVSLTALLFGLTESWIESDVLSRQSGIMTAITIGLYLTPLYCHYAFDAIIWRRGHREAPLVTARH